jgi:hypothetical protein
VKFGADGEWAKSRTVTMQFQDIKGTDMEQFKQPGRRVIVYPDDFEVRQAHIPLRGGAEVAVPSVRDTSAGASRRAFPSPERRWPVRSLDLLLNAVVAGVLLGGFCAAVSLGISVTFGLLDVVNIAHPVFVIRGAYTASMLNNGGLSPASRGFGIGYLTLRLRGVFFSIATLAVVLETIVINWEYVGGAKGINIIRPSRAPLFSGLRRAGTRGDARGGTTRRRRRWTSSGWSGSTPRRASHHRGSPRSRCGSSSWPARWRPGRRS